MASHQVAIAKASLAAGLLRPDPTSVARDEITNLHSTLDRALSHCSPANIQRCKAWLLEYVVASSNRVTLLAKYLGALSGSLETGSEAKDGKEKEKEKEKPRTSAKRKRLHILYLLNDLFHHTKYHSSSTSAFSALCGSLQPHMVELLSYAACYDREKNPKHHRRLSELLDIWQKHGYFGADYVGKLREVVANSAVSGPVTTSSATPGAESREPNRKARDGPYVMPSTHGDPSTPYYDLPAGNLIPHIIPNSTVPLRPDMIKPLQFVAGPADGKLVEALKVFLADVDQIYSAGGPKERDREIVDIDELGQTVIRDEITGDILEGETYYGWSRSFCQQMKKRDARDRSQSRSRSRSRSPPKRRRYSSASDDSRYRSSRSRSRSPRRDRYDSRSRSRSRSYSPAPAPPAPASAPSAPQAQHHPQQHQYPPSQHTPYNQPPFPPQHQPHQMHYPPAQHAFPPPPPPNYQGAWPPPPPPQMPNFPPAFQQMHQMPPGAPPPPPPPPGPPGSYGYPPGGRGWNQHPPPPPPSGRGWR
ncbi:hypothetical protein BDW74DRAFT_40096 [Aspergillus multicolor]|uniref:RNA polymerase II-binding domain-containing protein n=1 Tax=Aspergillus multicolor TaxID=41759 RepID=UPI003CCE0CCF